jgi:hypothetical protein
LSYWGQRSQPKTAMVPVSLLKIKDARPISQPTIHFCWYHSAQRVVDHTESDLDSEGSNVSTRWREGASKLVVIRHGLPPSFLWLVDGMVLAGHSKKRQHRSDWSTVVPVDMVSCPPGYDWAMHRRRNGKACGTIDGWMMGRVLGAAVGVVTGARTGAEKVGVWVGGELLGTRAMDGFTSATSGAGTVGANTGGFMGGVTGVENGAFMGGATGGVLGCGAVAAMVN